MGPIVWSTTINSLLDIVVFGRACALRIADIAKPGDKIPALKADAGLDAIQNLDEMRYSSGQLSTASIRNRMQKVAFFSFFFSSLSLKCRLSLFILLP